MCRFLRLRYETNLLLAKNRHLRYTKRNFHGVENNFRKEVAIRNIRLYMSRMMSAAAAADKMMVHIKTKLNKSNFWLRITGCFVTSAGRSLNIRCVGIQIKYVYIQIKMHGISNSEG